jgi:type I restriction enzyme R subunit
MPSNKEYKLVAENPQSTVVAEYAATNRTAKAYQSELELERAFIEQLQSQAYEYLPITAEADLAINLRKQLEKLNAFTFSDIE